MPSNQLGSLANLAQEATLRQLAQADMLSGGGTKVVTLAATPEVLTAAFAGTCTKIMFQPIRNADGTPSNTKSVFVGLQGHETLEIQPFATGITISCTDPTALYVEVQVNGEGIRWTPIG